MPAKSFCKSGFSASIYRMLRQNITAASVYSNVRRHSIEMLPTCYHNHPFEALCALASRERWCWKIVCTTCGHMLFRYALRQLASGKSPNDEDWLVHKDYPVLRRGSPLRELGPIPPLASWPIEEQARLAKILSTADILVIASACIFPDWLGYLGLALHYTEDVERRNHSLTHAWCPQLQRLVRPASVASNMLSKLSMGQEGVLTWCNLEAVERGVLA